MHWNDLFAEWKTADLRSRWAATHPDLFEPQDILAKQPSKFFAEWYAAILIKQRLGWLSLIGKYGYHGHKTHVRKQQILRRCLTVEQHRYVVGDPVKLFGHKTGWPDLFVYRPDYSAHLFCEVKGPEDGFSTKQLAVASALENETRTEVVQFRFRYRSSV
jgi:hypothetical protein